MNIEDWEKESICKEAQALVFGDRGELYDHPYIDYSRTVKIFKELSGIELSASEGVLFMIAVKLSRLGNAKLKKKKPKKFRDTLTDLAGYADCYWAVTSIEEQKQNAYDQLN